MICLHEFGCWSQDQQRRGDIENTDTGHRYINRHWLKIFTLSIISTTTRSPDQQDNKIMAAKKSEQRTGNFDPGIIYGHQYFLYCVAICNGTKIACNK